MRTNSVLGSGRRVDATQQDLLDWIAANRYVPPLSPQQREQYLISAENDGS
jgi:hypothetical protein